MYTLLTLLTTGLDMNTLGVRQSVNNIPCEGGRCQTDRQLEMCIKNTVQGKVDGETGIGPACIQRWPSWKSEVN
jgi:hypothetical protein